MFAFTADLHETIQKGFFLSLFFPSQRWETTQKVSTKILDKVEEKNEKGKWASLPRRILGPVNTS
jgi:hypothetical protein